MKANIDNKQMMSVFLPLKLFFPQAQPVYTKLFFSFLDYRAI